MSITKVTTHCAPKVYREVTAWDALNIVLIQQTKENNGKVKSYSHLVWILPAAGATLMTLKFLNLTALITCFNDLNSD